jgi:hypothetical protein
MQKKIIARQIVFFSVRQNAFLVRQNAIYSEKMQFSTTKCNIVQQNEKIYHEKEKKNQTALKVRRG